MSDVILFGATSMLGWSIFRSGSAEDLMALCNALSPARPPGIVDGIDLDEEEAVVELFGRVRPRLVINCAGVCDVGTCEASPEFAHAVNVKGRAVARARACRDAHRALLERSRVLGRHRTV